MSRRKADPSTKFFKKINFKPNYNPPVSSSIPGYFRGVLTPHPRPNHVENQIAGISTRAGCVFLPRSVTLRKEFYAWFRKYFLPRFEPAKPMDLKTVEEWLDTSKYSGSRRKQLLRKWETMHRDGFRARDVDLTCNSFDKDEDYLEYKAVRAINSRTDEFKLLVAPYFQLVDKVLFADPAFIKTIPVRDRPAYILDRLGDYGIFIGTDYSAFESLFDRELMLNIELAFYEHVWGLLQEKEDLMQLVRKAMTNVNRCEFKNMSVHLLGRRMSGEMCTSSGNGLTNLALMEFVCYKSNCDVVGVVEGDDGLFSVHPREGYTPVTAAKFEELGFRIKLETFSRVSEASFCSLIFDPEEKINIVDPLPICVPLAWTSRRYVSAALRTKLSLLKAKAMSYFYQYPGCPVVQSYVMYLLRMTKRYSVNRIVEHANWWDRLLYDEMGQFIEGLKYDELVAKLYKPVGPRTREMVERLFGLPVEAQLRLEDYFDHCDELRPVPQELFIHLVPDVFIDFFDTHVMNREDAYPGNVFPDRNV